MDSVGGVFRRSLNCRNNAGVVGHHFDTARNAYRALEHAAALSRHD